MATYLGFEPTKEDEYYFISYNSEDNERVAAVLKGLLDNDVPLWYDYGIEYGSMWESIIAERIDHAKAIILFVTKGIFGKGQKSYVKREWDMADIYEKDVLVINMDNIHKRKIPYELISWWIQICEKQNVSAIEYKGEALTNEILKALGIEPKPAKLEGNFVYVTYAGRDEQAANDICDALEKNGVKTFKPDIWSTGPGFNPDIKEAIDTCSSIVAILSDNAINSRSFMNEVRYSISIGKPLIPVKLEECPAGPILELASGNEVRITEKISAASDDIVKLVKLVKSHATLVV